LIIIKVTKASYSWNRTDLCIYRYNKWRHFRYQYWYWVLASLDANVLGAQLVIVVTLSWVCAL